MSNKAVLQIKNFLKIMSLQAIETIMQQNYDPHVMFCTAAVVGLPEHLYSEKFVTINLSPDAIDEYFESEIDLSFKTKFSGITHHLFLKKSSIVQIVAIDRATGVIAYAYNPLSAMIIPEGTNEALAHSLMSDSEEEDEVVSSEGSPVTVTMYPRPPKPIPGVPHLRLVK